jgi:hypothetical protein
MMANFKQQLENKLLENGLKDSSVKLYIRNLEKLNDDNALKNLNFLKKKDDIEKKLSSYSDNTKRTFLISIVSSLKTDEKLKKLHDYYYNKLMDVAKLIKSNETNEPTQKQKDNWIEWDEITKIIKKMESDAKQITGKNINNNDYLKLLKLVILSLYYYIAPRRNADYLNMVMKTNKKNIEPDKNYIILDNDPEFVFNNYKTSKRYGSQSFTIPEELLQNINMYLKYYPIEGKKNDRFFLVYHDGTPLNNSNNSITRILNNIFDKKVGSSMLRHIYLSNKYKDLTNEQIKDAKAMGHSLETQKDYIKLNDDSIEV